MAMSEHLRPRVGWPTNLTRASDVFLYVRGVSQHFPPEGETDEAWCRAPPSRWRARDSLSVGGIAWLQTNVAMDERVMAAPYVLMQLVSLGVSLFDLEERRYMSDSAALREARADWVVVDQREWEYYVARTDSTAFESALGACCGVPRYRDAAVRVFRVQRPE